MKLQRAGLRTLALEEGRVRAQPAKGVWRIGVIMHRKLLTLLMTAA